MTESTDPRIEAVAKLLFTGPLWGYNEGDWERAKANRWTGYSDCLMAAEDVLRGIDEAAEWEYGMSHGAEVEPKYDEQHARSSALTLTRSGIQAEAIRRRIGQWEPLP